MEDPKSDSLNELVTNFSGEEFERLKEHAERIDRATAAPMERAPSTRTGMFLPSAVPELRGRENLVAFMQRFRTWACITRYDSALDSEIIVKTSGTPLAELERLHDRTLVDNSLQERRALTNALEKEEEILKMVPDIRSTSEAWRALAKTADDSEEVAYDRTKREIETLEIGVSESVAEYFARVHIVLMKLERYKITTPAREIRRIVLSSLTFRFPSEIRLYAMRGNIELSDLEAGLIRAEKFQSEQQRRNTSAHALAVAHAGSGQTGVGGGARGRGRQGRRSGKRHDSGRNQQHQQQGHPQHAPPAQHQHQSPPWQRQQQSPAWQQQQQQQRHPQP